MKPRGYAPVGTEDDSALQDGVALRLLAKYCPTLMDDEDQQLRLVQGAFGWSVSCE